MGITFKINVQFILNEYDEKLNFKQKKIKTMNDEMFQRYKGENETYIEASAENGGSVLYDKEIRDKPRTRRTKRNV